MFDHVAKRNVEGIGLAILLAFGVLTIGAVNRPVVLQNASAAGETIAPSKTAFFGSNVVEVTVTDPNLKDNNDDAEFDEITVSFDVFSGGDTGNDDVTIGDGGADTAEIGDTGKFVFYLTADSDVVIGDLADPEFGGDSELVFIGELGDVDVGTDAGNSAFDGATDGISLDEGATIEITYGDASLTLTYEDDKAAVSLDRSTVGSDGFVYLRVDDQDANNDPTDRDLLDFTFNDDLTMSYTGIGNSSLGQIIKDNDLDFQETTDNSGIFEVRLSVVDILGLTAADTPKSVSIKLEDFEVYPNDLFYDDAAEDGILGNSDSTKSITVDNSDGILQEVTNPATPNSELKIIVNDPDRNLDSKVKDRITDAIAAELSSSSSDPGTLPLTPIDLIETGVNTGLFVPDLSDNLVEVTIKTQVSNDGILQIKNAAAAKSDLDTRYGDLTPDDSTDLNVKIQGSGANNAKEIRFKGKVAATAQGIISLGQSRIGAQDKVFLVLTDSDLNDDKASVDSFDLMIPAGCFDSGECVVDGISYNGIVIAKLELDGVINGEPADGSFPLEDIEVSFQETGANTGIFDKTFDIAASFGDCVIPPADLANARLVATYDDKTASTLLKANNGILTSSSKTINSGQEITISVTDPDQNHDRDVKEQVAIVIEPDGLGASTKLLDETDLNTGVFTKKFVVGEDFDILDDGEVVDEVVVTYDDAVTSNGGNEERELKLIPPTSNGKLTISPEKNIGPGTKVTITLVDVDLNEDPNSEDIIDTDVLEIGTDNNDIDQDSIALGDDSLQMEETNNNSGEFKLTMTLIPITPEMKDSDADIAFLASGDELDFPAEPGDTIAITYEDENHDKGGEDTINVIIEVKAFDPVITTDKEAYLPGDTMIVTIADPDANRDPDVIDVIEDVRIFTSGDRVGDEFDAVETGSNTGIFTVQVPIVEDFESDAIKAEIGDKITIEYTDEFPADYDPDDEDDKEFTHTVAVGRISSTGTAENTTPSEPEVKDSAGHELDEVAAGQQVVLTTTVTNNLDDDQPFVALVEVRDSNEVTVYLAWQTGMLDAEAEVEVGLSFEPEKAGAYIIRTFVISELANPDILSDVVESEFMVS